VVTADDDCLFAVDTVEAAQLVEQHPSDVRAAAMRRARNGFRVHPVPVSPMSTAKYRPPLVSRPAPDDLQPQISYFEGAADARERFRWTLRDSLDELLDGQRTGRWCYQHLMKTEKTYLGTAIEINLTREFEITEGDDLDWRIHNAEVDCKFSRNLGEWEIPMEMYICVDHGTQSGKANHPAALVWFNDDNCEWAAGLLRITDDRLRWRKDKAGNPVRAYNRDNKRRIAENALSEIYWLWGGLQKDLPPNLFLHLPPTTRAAILRERSSGQGRVNDLFRHVQGRLIERQAVLTAGQQDDAPKRARDARIHLRPDGIIVLGHEEPHRRIAASLELPTPHKGSWISVRVVPTAHRDAGRFLLDGKWWAKASELDRVLGAPSFPKDWSELQTNSPHNRIDVWPVI
jgi:hypothetical protein